MRLAVWHQIVMSWDATEKEEVYLGVCERSDKLFQVNNNQSCAHY